MPPQLVAMTEGPNILLDKPIVLIGRHQECDIQIPSRKISRRHCCVAQVNDHLVVRDLCSTNGVRINGVRVLEGALNAGDELTIGNICYEVRLNDEPLPAKALPAKVEPPPASGPFESWDQPVALKDYSHAVVPEAAIPKAPGVKPPDSPPPAAPSLVLPDNLKLAPAGNEYTPPSSRK